MPAPFHPPALHPRRRPHPDAVTAAPLARRRSPRPTQAVRFRQQRPSRQPLQ